MALALYRTYRPGSLAEVIGQGHVTEPLARALAANRIHHAYLFSGPRGCGKTSTARILARSLNCEQGPTAQPCGTCRSCVELAPNGPGSIDVVELDAATHRGIDDARELREKAIYAPAAGRYKIYIIDEAHQLTNEAANALLKLVEEPPPHLRFIFATTEPDKIIPTIRSRTFHYGFRLVPTRTLAEHLGSVCRSEGVPAQAPALAVVARAGAGSVRDSLSVLGQLLAGAGPEGLTYVEAIAALGLTDTALIDDFVAALAAGSAADMFGIVDHVIAAGHDPRRFVIDALDRLRDLIVLRVDHEALAKGLVEAPDDTGERMLAQSQSLGLAELSRAADLVSAGLTQIKGATAPRLQLELLCARLALPVGGEDLAGVLARIERLERGVGSAPAATEQPRSQEPGTERAGTDEPTPEPASAVVRRPETRATHPPAAPITSPVRPTPPCRPQLRSVAPTSSADPSSTGAPSSAEDSDAPREAALPASTAPPESPAPASPVSGVDASDREAPTAPTQEPPPTSGGHGATGEHFAPGAGPDPRRSAPTSGGQSTPASTAAGGPTGLDQLARVRDAWPAVLDRLALASRVAWTAFHAATPVTCTEGALAVAVAEPGNVRAIAARGHDERLRQALIDVLGLDVTIDVLHDPEAARGSSTGAPNSSEGSAGSGDARPGGASEAARARSGTNSPTSAQRGA
ncbi:MAG: DNA polymerase III subunit gamma and tau, partial [Candidatus Nanopelagicales bacterium]